MKLECYRQIFEKYSNIKFHEKSVHWEPSCSLRTDGQTEEWIGGQADMTKLIIVFRNSANAPKNENNISLGARIAQSVKQLKNYRQARRGIGVGFAAGTKRYVILHRV